MKTKFNGLETALEKGNSLIINLYKDNITFMIIADGREAVAKMGTDKGSLYCFECISKIYYEEKCLNVETTVEPMDQMLHIMHESFVHKSTHYKIVKVDGEYLLYAKSWGKYKVKERDQDIYELIIKMFKKRMLY